MKSYLSSHSVRLLTKYSFEPEGRNRLRVIRSKTDFRLGHSRSILAAAGIINNIKAQTNYEIGY